MIISERIVAGKCKKKIKELLIKCDTCGNEQWWRACKCKNGERKYCSVKCINVGRKKPEEIKKYLSEINKGENNKFFGKHHSDETRRKMSSSHTIDNSLKATMKERLSDEEFKIYWDKYCSKHSGSNNSFFGKTHTKEMREHLSYTRANLIANGKIDIKPSHYGLKGYYTSKKSGEIFRFDSFCEYLRMIILDADNNVISWTKRHHIRIKYELDDVIKNYIPDFLIIRSDGREVIEEVKGYENHKKKMAKFSALKKYCIDNNFECSIVLYNDIKNVCPSIFGKSIDCLRELYKKGLFNG